MIVLDASVLIAYLEGEDEHHAAADTLLRQAVDDDLGASSVTLAEILVVPLRTGCLAAARAVLEDLEVEELSFPADTALRLAHLRVDSGLKMPDCCALLAAEAEGASIASFDRRLVQAALESGVPVVQA